MQKEWLTEKDKILIPFNSKKLTLTAVDVLGVGICVNSLMPID